jgi:VWFA-related protein
MDPNPQNEGRDFVIRSDVRLVLLDVAVKDRAGAFAPGLTIDNFKVFENNRPQLITVFSAEDLPVTLGILVDESRSMSPKRAEVIVAAEALIRAGNPQDQAFILNFNDSVYRGLPSGELFSGEINQLMAALNRGKARGKTALYDAVTDGLDQLELSKRNKKALVVISDGGDNTSKHTRSDVFDRLERCIATVYAIGLLGGEDEEKAPGVLKRLANISGGEAVFPAELDELAEVCRGIAMDMRRRYTVGYVPPTSNGGSLRRISVSVRTASGAKLVARTRTQYRYENEPIAARG